MRAHPLRSVLLALAFLGASGCGGGDAASDQPARSDFPRIARQELRDEVGTLINVWLYDYDATGFPTGVRGYDGADTQVTASTYTYEGGKRTRSITRNPSGDPLYSSDFSYDAHGVLAGSTSYSATGDLSGTATYEFQGGRKTKTTRYDAGAALRSWTIFHYGPTGARTGSTTYDAVGAEVGTSTRVTLGGRLTEATLVNGTTTTRRSFTYEDGPNRIDAELFFEF